MCCLGALLYASWQQCRVFVFLGIQHVPVEHFHYHVRSSAEQKISWLAILLYEFDWPLILFECVLFDVLVGHFREMHSQ